MLDSLGAFEDMLRLSEVADLLFNAGQTVNPSEIHGVMVGLLASGFDPEDDNHLAQTVAATERAIGMDIAGELAEMIGRLSLATLSAIVDSDYAFQPMLPSDDDVIERLRSLSAWVTGFYRALPRAYLLEMHRATRSTHQPPMSCAILPCWHRSTLMRQIRKTPSVISRSLLSTWACGRQYCSRCCE